MTWDPEIKSALWTTTCGQDAKTSKQQG